MSDDRITTTRREVTFTQPFMLRGFDTPHSPGTFDVDVDSESIEGVSSIAHRYVATFIYLRDGGGTRMVNVDPVELAAAIEHDRTCRDASAERQPG